jgi:predicted Zn-dependent protease
VREICALGVDAALAAGASHVDARAVLRRDQSVRTKNGAVESADDAKSEGLGVRVLGDGAWGFACDCRLSAEGARATSRATEFARAAAEGDESEAVVHAERSGLARMASSEVHQPTLIENRTVTIRVVRDGSVGVATTNRIGERELWLHRQARPRWPAAPRRRTRSGRTTSLALPRRRSAPPTASRSMVR